MKQQLAPILILFAAMLWGTTGTVQALAPTPHPVAIGRPDCLSAVCFTYYFTFVRQA